MVRCVVEGGSSKAAAARQFNTTSKSVGNGSSASAQKVWMDCAIASQDRLAFAYRWSIRAIMLDKTDATKLLTKIWRQWFAERKSVGYSRGTWRSTQDRCGRVSIAHQVRARTPVVVGVSATGFAAFTCWPIAL